MEMRSKHGSEVVVGRSGSCALQVGQPTWPNCAAMSRMAKEHIQHADIKCLESSACSHPICLQVSQPVSPASNFNRGFPTLQHQISFNIRRRLSLPSTNTRTRLLPLHLSANNPPSHPSPATQALLGLLEALALLLLFAVDPDKSGGAADRDGEDWIESSVLEDEASE